MNKQTLAKVLAVTISLSSVITPISTIAAHEQNTQISSSMSSKTLTNEQLKKEISKLQNEITQQKQILKQKNDSIPGLENKIQQDKVNLKNLKELKFTLDINKTNYEKSIKETNKQYNEVKSKLEEAKSQSSGLTSAEQQRLNELSKIYENEELDGMRFYKSLNDKDVNEAIGFANKFQSTAVSGKTHLEMALMDGQNSALALDNQIRSAKILIKANEKRAQYGLPKINTSAYIQFLTQVKLEGDKRIRNHYPLEFTPNLSENVMYGGEAFKNETWENLTNNYFKLAYENEKTYFDTIVKDLYPGTTFNSFAERSRFYEDHYSEIETEAAKRGQIVGHYTNLIDFSSYSLMGMSTVYGLSLIHI